MNYLKICKKHQQAFEKHMKGVELEERGMLASEMLLVYAVVKELGVTHVIESGRARGYSTYALAKTLPDVKITSLDFDKYSKDTRYAKKRLRKFDNVELLHGNSMKLLPRLVKEDCVVVIDGPKGEPALMLAIELLKNKKVKAVFIHDLAKNLFERVIAEQLFPGAYFTDADEYVKLFRSLDKGYKQAGVSYGGPIGVINTLDSQVVAHYEGYYARERNLIRKSLKNMLERSGVLYSLYERITRLFGR